MLCEIQISMSIDKGFWNTAIPIRSCIVYGCFCCTRQSCVVVRDLMVLRA